MLRAAFSLWEMFPQERPYYPKKSLPGEYPGRGNGRYAPKSSATFFCMLRMGS